MEKHPSEPVRLEIQPPSLFERQIIEYVALRARAENLQNEANVLLAEAEKLRQEVPPLRVILKTEGVCWISVGNWFAKEFQSLAVARAEEATVGKS